MWLFAPGSTYQARKLHLQSLQCSESECSLSNLNYLRFRLFCFFPSSLIILPPSRTCLRPLLLLLASTILAFTVLLSAMLPFAALHRAISASASFILVLFIYLKFYVTDDQNRSLFFSGSNACPLFSHLSASALYCFFPHSTTA